jgi:hypothetical protein
MPNPKKQEYYRKNREARLEYQNKWYKQNKSKYKRKDEILQVTDPEEWEQNRKKKHSYNRAYYLKNRAQLCAKQRARYAEVKVEA